jgi:hypothetical protein
LNITHLSVLKIKIETTFLEGFFPTSGKEIRQTPMDLGPIGNPFPTSGLNSENFFPIGRN